MRKLVGLYFLVACLVSVPVAYSQASLSVEKKITWIYGEEPWERETYDPLSPPGPSIPVGDLVNFNVFVNNTGDVTLYNVTVVDDVWGPLTTVAVAPPGPVVHIIYAGIATPGQYVNTASAVGHAVTGAIANASDTAYYFGVDGQEPTVPVLPAVAVPVALMVVGALGWRRRESSREA